MADDKNNDNKDKDAVMRIPVPQVSGFPAGQSVAALTGHLQNGGLQVDATAYAGAPKIASAAPADKTYGGLNQPASAAVPNNAATLVKAGLPFALDPGAQAEPAPFAGRSRGIGGATAKELVAAAANHVDHKQHHLGRRRRHHHTHHATHHKHHHHHHHKHPDVAAHHLRQENALHDRHLPNRQEPAAAKHADIPPAPQDKKLVGGFGEQPKLGGLDQRQQKIAAIVPGRNGPSFMG